MKITGDVLNEPAYGMRQKLINHGYKSGDEIWATAYSLQSTKEAKRLKCTPVKGVLSNMPNDSKYTKICADPRYFIPYGRNKKLSYSKAVRVESRQYADTEQEALEIYNDAVQLTVDMFEELTNKAKQDFLR